MEIKDEVLDENNERIVYQNFPPLGVCRGIVPWNWPVLLGMGKLGPALITGNTFIIKPSPFTPYCDLKLGEIDQLYRLNIHWKEGYGELCKDVEAGNTRARRQ